MTTIEITDDQWDRIEALRTELAANHAGKYATVEDTDVLAYLLDLEATVEDPNRQADVGEVDSTDADRNADAEESEEQEDGEESEAAEGGEEPETAENDEVPETEDAGQLNAMLSLLDTHADKWRQADGDARYEVDLPGGGVETARTKDDVRALLFKHHR